MKMTSTQIATAIFFSPATKPAEKSIEEGARLIREFAKGKCKDQRKLVANELVTWTEDLSLPNQIKIHELCESVDEPEM